jgi:hypothetical protein
MPPSTFDHAHDNDAPVEDCPDPENCPARRGALNMTTPAPSVIQVRLCDDDGMVSDQPVEPGSHGTALDPDLTYLRLLNNLRAQTGLPPVREPFPCTGAAHLAGEEFHCTGPAHLSEAQLTSLRQKAAAYDDAVLAWMEVSGGGPLSTTVGYLIRTGLLKFADPQPTATERAENWRRASGWADVPVSSPPDT